MKDSTVNIIGFVGIALVLILLKTCEGATTVPKETVVVTTKTVIDTIPFYVPTPIEVPVTITIPVYKTYYDTVRDTMYAVKEYNNEFKDSLIDGNIFSRIALDGTLVEQNFKYTPKFPKYIKQTDSVFTTITKYPEEKVQVYAGLGGGVGLSTLTVFPKLGIETKNNTLIDIGYDPFNKIGYTSITKKLTLKR